MDKQKKDEYVKMKISQILQKNYGMNLSNSLVDRILILDCCLNAFSSDQIGQSRFNARAKYGTSFICGDNFLASTKKEAYSSLDIVTMFFLNKENIKKNSEFFMPENLIILSLSEISSSITNSGDTRIHSLSSINSIIFLLVESFLKKEKSMLASITIFFGNDCIFYYNSCFFATLSFSLPVRMIACSSFRLDLDKISSDIENSTLLTSCEITFESANSNAFSNSDGTSILTNISAILKYIIIAYIKFSIIRLTYWINNIYWDNAYNRLVIKVT